MEQFRSLFLKLDHNRDGFIATEELHREMEKIGLTSANQKAAAIVGSFDRDADGRLNYDEFLEYLQSRESTWKINFQVLDKNKCGVIDHEEIMDLFKDLGLIISEPSAKKIIQMMDRDGSMTVDWDEFLQHIVLNPVENITDLVFSWKRAMVFDVGESRTVPVEFSPDERASGAWKQHMMAAGMADAVSRTLTAPIDRLKTQLQVYGSKALSQGLAELRLSHVRSMWQGNAVNVLKGTPQSTLQYFIYTQMKTYAQLPEDRLTVQHRFGLGCISGALAHALFYPLEVLKVRLNLQAAGSYGGVLACAASVYRTGSAVAFYRGFRSSLLCMIPYAGVECAVHQSIMNWGKQDQARTGDSRLFLISFVAFASGQTASYPLAVIRTQQQAHTFSTSLRSPGVLQCLTGIYAQHGMRGFYSGMGASFVRALPCAVLNYTITAKLEIMLSSHM